MANQILAAAIYNAAESLGASTDASRSLPKSVRDCPDFIAEFYARFKWPRSATFDAPDIAHGLDSLRFDSLQELPPEYSIPETGGMRLFAIGSHGGDGWILLVDGNDSKPSDPYIYDVDHECPEDEPINRLGRLSELLESLTPA